jgi:predicted CXXCH cytochrome family protein
VANNPVGTVNRQAMFHTDLRPAAGLPQEMEMPDGRVSCLSCHRGYSRQHGALAVELDRLCVTCHDK